METKKITKDTVVNSTELAAILGLSVRRIQQLIQAGRIVTDGKGKMNLSEAVQCYIHEICGSAEDEEDREIDLMKRRADAQLKQSKAEMARLEAAELKEKKHRQEDVETLVGDMIFGMRSAWLAIPERVAVDCAAVDFPAEVSVIIQKEVHQIMAELATYSYDPKRYEERVRDRRAWDMELMEEGE